MAILFYILFFATPLIMWPYTSEIFEFNKMIFVYSMTTLITANWITTCIKHQKIIFRRTMLDIPILIFLISQLISTLLSIDPRTSLLGYYSRFNGGLVSIICYSILYWAYVSNITTKQSLYSIFYILYSFVLVSLYGIAQRLGIDKDIWVQDVQNRVFSTLGQPNWLAASLVALLPIIFNFKFSIKITDSEIVNQFLNYVISTLFFITLLFTKSRSGLLAFLIADIIFWALIFYKEKFKNLKLFLIINSIFVVSYFVFNTPFTIDRSPITVSGPALESGGTESGDIRKIVWTGAIDIWKAYPIFGSGPETFAYIYPSYRPSNHNLVSEWDFIYNKAHNEYLNLLATSGLIGLISYLVLIIFSIIQLAGNFQFSIFNFQSNKTNYKWQNDKSLKNDNWKMINVGLLAGYISILVTNFFGFSVVITQLFLFLFPAIALKSNE